MKTTHGTPYYIAPEVLKESYNEKCDIWSCGVIFYILLTGIPPFNGANDEEILSKVLDGYFHFKPPTFKSVSSQCKDLIRKLLSYDVKKRITATEALSHPWFKTAGESEYELDQEIMANLANFSIKNKMQQTLYYFLISQTISSDQRDKLATMFKRLDLNNDGVISKEELQ